MVGLVEDTITVIIICAVHALIDNHLMDEMVEMSEMDEMSEREIFGGDFA